MPNQIAGLLSPAGEMQATPRNKLLGLLADGLNSVNDYAQSDNYVARGGGGKKTKNPLSELANFVSLPAIATTLDRVSYGDSLMQGSGQTYGMRPETAEVALMAPFSPRTALGLLGAADTGLGKAMFIGAKAKTWDAAKAAKAAEMEQAGTDARKIWSETGTFKGADGKWRQEIDDSGALFNWREVDGRQVETDVKTGYPGINLGNTLGGLLKHDPLEAAYGRRLVSNTFVENGDMLGAVKGSFDEANDVLRVYAPTAAEGGRSTALHELQHAVQGREDFARGGSPEWAAQEKGRLMARINFLNQELSTAAKAMDTVPQGSPQYAEFRKTYDAAMEEKMGMNASLVQGDAVDSYKRLAGEAEARATQARMNMTPAERLAKFPFDSYDVPVDSLIVRGLLK